MKLLKTNLLILFTILTLQNSFAISKYWTGGSGNWTDASHWVLLGGGATTVPSISDNVFIRSTSGSGTITVNSSVSIAYLTFNANCSAIILDIVSNNFSIANTLTMNTPNNGTIRISGGSFSATATSNISGGNLILNSGTMNFQILNFTNTANANLNGGVLNVLTLNIPGGNVTLGGTVFTVSNEFTLSSAGVFNANSGTLNINGTADVFTISLGGTANFNGATVNIGNSTDESIYINGGIVNVLSGNITISNKLLCSTNGTFSMSDGLISIGVGNNVTATSLELSGNGTVSGGTINIASVLNSSLAIDISVDMIFSGGLVYVTESNYDYTICPRSIYNLEINSPGRTITWDEDNCIIYGNLIVTDGIMNSTIYKVTFQGTAIQSISGAGAVEIKFYDLELNNSNGLKFGSPFSGIETTITNELTLTSGHLTLDNYTLNIGDINSAGTITGASTNSYIITNGSGVLRQFNIGSTGLIKRNSAFYPIGINATSYTPITLTQAGSSTTDNFSVTVAQNVYSDGYSGTVLTSDAVDRTWYISEDVATGSRITITPQWNLSDELSSFTRSLSEVRHHDNTSWVTTNSAFVQGSDPYTLESGVITSFSPFAIFDGTVLPITLIDFSVKTVLENVEINWTTENEINNDYFQLTKSFDGKKFDVIDEIKGQGNSTITNHYQSIDSQNQNKTTYYQLIQNDFDGNKTTSNIISIQNTGNKNSNYLFPNPSTNETVKLHINHFNPNQKIELKFIDNSGKTILTLNETPTSNIVSIETQNLKNGIYDVIIKSNDTISYQKIVIY